MSQPEIIEHGDGRPTAEVWEIPRRVWLILASWGLALFMSFGLLSFWIWSNEREEDRARDELQARQDGAMCAMLDLSRPTDEQLAKLTPQQRDVLKAMDTYRATLTCPSP